MRKNTFDSLTKTIQDSLPPNSKQRLGHLANILKALCSMENVQSRTELDLALSLIVADSNGIDIAYILDNMPPEISETEFNLIRQLVVSRGRTLSNREGSKILADVLLLEQIGAMKLTQVFVNWDGMDSRKLYNEVREACKQAHDSLENLHTKAAKSMANKRILIMDQYLDMLKDEIGLLL